MMQNGQVGRTMMTPLMLVSKDKKMQGDLYTESDAEEIYLPDHYMRKQNRLGNGRQSLVTDDSQGVVGYQKYLHIVNRMAVDNTDAREPNQPELSQFLRVGEAEHDQELQ